LAAVACTVIIPAGDQLDIIIGQHTLAVGVGVTVRKANDAATPIFVIDKEYPQSTINNSIDRLYFILLANSRSDNRTPSKLIQNLYVRQELDG
jgi:hypothetical protein